MTTAYPGRRGFEDSLASGRMVVTCEIATGDSPDPAGLLRRAEKWTQVSPASISIGQEIAVTPLQITRAVGSVATGGMLVEPRIVKRIVDEEGKTVHEPPRGASRRVMSEKTAAVLNEILKSVVSRGTGEQAAIA